MSEEKLLKVHDEILKILLEYKKQENDFTFSPRKKNVAERLDKGYWFQGNENYIFVPLYKRGCKDNKTKTIGFVYQENRQYIELVYKNVENITEHELDFYKELEIFLSKSDRFNIEKRNEKQYFFVFKENNLKNNLHYFLDEFRDKIEELLIKYNLRDLYYIAEQELTKRLNRIEKIRNNYKTLRNDRSITNMEKNMKNIILYGPPGVGKTHNYQRLISMIEEGKEQKEIFDTITDIETNQKTELGKASFQKIEEGKRVEFVTFHQSYSYEDFIEGFRPIESGNIKLEDGIFKRIAEEAKKNLQDNRKDSAREVQNYYIVIDEINRGNISKIFGELITLIEEDKRDIYEVTLPYSKDKFMIPSNLYIIATMNSTDKSIATIDIALRRRFTFLKMKPNSNLVENVEARHLMKSLNTEIKEKLGEDFMFGHSYFMGETIDLDFLKEYKIRPLLEEYFYSDESVDIDKLLRGNSDAS